MTTRRPDPIGDYLDRLARRVRGRVGAERLLEEVADHLDDARDHLVARGLAPHAAACTAVARLGAARKVARALPTPHRRILASTRLVAALLTAVGAAGLLALPYTGAAHLSLVQITGGFVGVTILEQLRRRSVTG